MKEKDKETVCATVVTYNRKNLLLECLEALRKQTRPIQSINLIDNASTDGTPELLLEKGYIKELPPKDLAEPWEKEFEIENLTDGQLIKLYYVRMHENTGGAGGFHEGVKRSYEKGYDWLWLMDDDVEPEINALEELLKFKYISKCIHPLRKYLNGEEILWEGYIDIITGIRVNLDNFSFKNGKNFTCVNIGCFEGMLIHRDIVNKIGYPDKRFFIIYDDTVYGLLANRFTNVIFIKDSILIKKIIKTNEFSEFSSYYFIRNLFLKKKFIDNLYPKYIKLRNLFFILKLCHLYIKVLKSLKLKSFKIIFKATLHGIKNDYTN